MSANYIIFKTLLIIFAMNFWVWAILQLENQSWIVEVGLTLPVSLLSGFAIFEFMTNGRRS